MNNPIQDKLLQAYDTMLERLHEAVKQVETKTLPSIDEQLRNAREKAVELGELTREEADKVAEYLQRDIEDASSYLQDTKAELSDWLSFESTLLENKIGDWLSLVADKTTLEWDKIKLQAIKSQLYHSGEITGSGTLECISCGQTLHFKKTGHIPPCPTCHKTEFKRNRK